jgi:ABC-type antimicrobial peptide transport system permease subunit
MLAVFGGLALLLTVVGLYSVVAFSVAQRTREIGIRMALGADRNDVLRLVVRQGLIMTVTGIMLGLALAFAAGQLLAQQLTGVSGTDPVSYIVTAAGLLAISLLACFLPARRAAVLDPLKALRRD